MVMKPKKNQKANASESLGYDRCQTPAYAVAPLLPYLFPDRVIWEPAAGEGYLVKALKDGGCHNVIASDILTGQNFFTYRPEEFGVIITNPPYTIKTEWLERCYDLGRPFALLVPVETIGTKGAQQLMERYGAEILLLDKRVNFKMPEIGWGTGNRKSAAQFPTLWLCHGILPTPICYGRINYKYQQQLSLFDLPEVASAQQQVNLRAAQLAMEGLFG